MTAKPTSAIAAALFVFLVLGCDGADGRPVTDDGGQGAVDSSGPTDVSDRSDAAFDRGWEDTGTAVDADDGGPAADDRGPEVEDGGIADAATDVGFDAELPPLLNPEQIGFEEVAPPMAGSVIYFATWARAAGEKDTVQMLRPDKSETAVRFRADRVWSFGVAREGKTIAFSSADPFQEQNWGTTIYDAIQYTWILRPGEQPFQLTNGSINDECHSFMPGDAVLLMCRRANFWERTKGREMEFGNDPYRVITVDIGTGATTWLTPLAPGFDDIGPAPRDDGSILFWRQEFRNGKPYQSLMEMNGDGTGISYLRANSTGPVTSADGTKALFRSGGWRKLALAPSHDVGSALVVLDGGTRNIYDYDFSPDLSQIAFTMSRADGGSCSDLFVAGVDGSNATRIIDCAAEGKAVTGVRWAGR